MEMDPMAVRTAWDAADAYVGGPRSGRGHSYHAFFGPAQVARCVDVVGARLLDVACAGYVAREMASRGAHVTAVDIAPRMVAHARRIESASPLGLTYAVLAAESLADAFAPVSFDVVTSCVALQDMPDPVAALRDVRAVLRDDARGEPALAVDRYLERGALEYHSRGRDADRTTRAHHVTLADWFASILGAGFTLRTYAEPRPSDDARRAHPGLEDAARVPYSAMFVPAR